MLRIIPDSLACLILTTVLCTAAWSAELRLDATDDESGVWAAATMSLKDKGEIVPRGLVLYTTDKKQAGAIFRCDAEKLYTVLSVKPLNLKKALMHGNLKPRSWEIGVSIDDEPEQTEVWASMSGGQLYMVPGKATSKAIFEAAQRGATVNVRTSKKKTTEIVLPTIPSAMVDDFVSACRLELQNESDTTVAANPPTQ